ncbi:MAG: DUF4124 domain-containing protein [Burkholderiales bacterium]|jgi:hypothetical protein|nr:DUF4124 domain-containing protein [Burkholderiales bacterium]
MAPDRFRGAVAGAFCLLALAAAPVSATVFVCTTADGRTITADRPPRECVGVPIRELRPDGSVRQVIEPPLSAEQQRARLEQAQRERKEREARRAQARQDIALLETYATEEDIAAARRAALTSRQAMIERSKKRLETFAEERKRLDDEVEFYVNRKVPDKLEQAIEANESLVQAEHRLIAEMEADMARINKRFDAEAERYRQLVSAGAKPLVRTSDGATR